MTAHVPCPHEPSIGRLDELSPEDRRRVLEHAESCPACRAALVDEDPSRGFALLAVTPIPDALLADLSASVADAIDSGVDREPRSGGAVRAVVAIAASLILALGTVLMTGTPEVVAPSVALAEGVEIVPGASLALLESPGEAHVMDLTVGETQVVMIFDQELDL